MADTDTGVGVKTPMSSVNRRDALPGPASIKAFFSNCFKVQDAVAVARVQKAVCEMGRTHRDASRTQYCLEL